jgi:phosphoribosylglycinamide formyltransferase 1
MINIALFASGGGSNVEAILQQLPSLCAQKKVKLGKVIVISNNPNAGVLNIAGKYGVPAKTIEIKNIAGEALLRSYTNILERYSIHFIVLAGYLKQIPAGLVSLYPKKIINIHPALLPKYGGKGMYGKYVHEAVVKAKEAETGITIHFVDEQYDNGATILQKSCAVLPSDAAETVAKKVLVLEHENYAMAIANCLLNIQNG